MKPEHVGMLHLMIDVGRFHTESTLPDLAGAPTPMLPEYQPRRATRIRLLHEEFREYVQAEDSGDIAGIADALADLIYIAVGTALIYGIPLEEIWHEVQRTNMAKLAGGVRLREDGKILKPDNWTPPDILAVLRKAGWRG